MWQDKAAAVLHAGWHFKDRSAHCYAAFHLLWYLNFADHSPSDAIEWEHLIAKFSSTSFLNISIPPCTATPPMSWTPCGQMWQLTRSFMTLFTYSKVCPYSEMAVKLRSDLVGFHPCRSHDESITSSSWVVSAEVCIHWLRVQGHWQSGGTGSVTGPDIMEWICLMCYVSRGHPKSINLRSVGLRSQQRGTAC